jgi:hypothetical protein
MNKKDLVKMRLNFTDFQFLEGDWFWDWLAQME